MKAQLGLLVPMRDGVRLVTDVYTPELADPAPAVVYRTPYGRDAALALADLNAYLRSGYAVVVQDVRGRFASEGVFHPFVAEADDGADLVEWVAAQVWCNGAVGLAGASYGGATQWTAAARRPPALRAIAPQITSASYYEGWTHQGGAFQLGFSLFWALANLALPDAALRSPESVAGIIAIIDSIGDAYRRLPLTDVPELGPVADAYREWLAHPEDDAFWRATAPREHYGDVTVPSLNIGGWYDCFLGGTLANYRGMRERGDGEQARRPRLVIGPWAHGVLGGDFAEIGFGVRSSAASAGLIAEQIRFFDRHVRGVDSDEEPPVRIFVMGANEWRSESDWPLPDTRFRRYHLHGSGRAGTDIDDGRLDPRPPDEDQPAERFIYDPADPVPTIGGQTFLPGLLVGANAGPRDQREVEVRPDVLCFTTPILDEPMEVSGPVSLTLYASSSAPDTDFTGKLVDVYPDGRALILTEGILRARFRNGFATAAPLTPGDIYVFEIDMSATSTVFATGHRIRLEVSSSNFPRFARNSNTGGVIATEVDSDYVAATNHVFHDRSRPSHLTLPIIQRS